jgi:hypothetical protein
LYDAEVLYFLVEKGKDEVARFNKAHILVKLIERTILVALRRPQIAAVDLVLPGLVLVHPPIGHRLEVMAFSHPGQREVCPARYDLQADKPVSGRAAPLGPVPKLACAFLCRHPSESRCYRNGDYNLELVPPLFPCSN